MEHIDRGGKKLDDDNDNHDDDSDDSIHYDDIKNERGRRTVYVMGILLIYVMLIFLAVYILY
jgi:hypothetical protein